MPSSEVQLYQYDALEQGGSSARNVSSSSKDQEEDIDEEEEDKETDASEIKKYGLCFGLSIISVIMGFIITTLCVNQITKSLVQSTGTAVTGAETSIEDVSISVLSARSSLNALAIRSPPPYSGPFLELGNNVFDLNIWSMLAPVFELEELSVRGVNVFIDSTATGQSNAMTILANAVKYREEHEPRLKKKFLVDRVDLRDIQAVISVHGLTALRPITWKVPRVLVTDVGKKRQGVSLAQLMITVLHALLLAVMVGAPGNIEENVLKGICSVFVKAVDIGHIHLDLGNGLTKVGQLVSQLTSTISNTTENAGDLAATAVGGISNAVGDVLPGRLGRLTDKTGKAIANIIDTSTDFSSRIVNIVGKAMSGSMGGCANWIVSNTLNPDTAGTK